MGRGGQYGWGRVIAVSVAAWLTVGCETTPAAPPPASTPTATATIPPAAASAAPEVAKRGAGTTCHEGIRELTQTLKVPMKVTLYVTRGTEKLDAFVRDLEKTTRQLAALSAGKLVVSVVEPKTDAEKQEAVAAGLQELAHGDVGGDAVTRGFLGVTFHYRDESVAIPVLSAESSRGLEFWLSNKIRELRDLADGSHLRVGVVDKKGMRLDEPNLVAQTGPNSPNLKGVLAQALPFYQLVDVDLDGGKASVPSDLEGVIVLQADEDWTEPELARLDEYVLLGNRSLSVFAGAVNLRAGDASMQGTLDPHRMDWFLDGYGIEMASDLVSDPSAQLTLFTNHGGRNVRVALPGVLLLTGAPGRPKGAGIDDSFAGFFRLDEVAYPYPSTLVTHPEKQPSAKMRVVASTSPEATSVSKGAVDLRPGQELAGGAAKRRDVAVVVEGVLKSSVKGRSSAGDALRDQSASSSRVLVVASPMFLANPLAYAGKSEPPDQDLQMLSMPYAQRHLTATILALKNVLDWMSGNEALLACSALLTEEQD